MPLLDTVNAAMIAAMKARDGVTLGTLRMLKTALTMKGIEKGRDLDDAESLQVVASLVKQRRDSIDQFGKGGRQDLVDKETAEIAVLEKYMPAAASPGRHRDGDRAGGRGNRRRRREGHGQGDEGGDGAPRRQDRRRQGGQRGGAEAALQLTGRGLNGRTSTSAAAKAVTLVRRPRVEATARARRGGW